MKLLVADDERWIRGGILKMIDQEQFDFEETLEAGSLKEFEELFLEQRPGIVISDVRFPNGTSCGLCQKLYEISPDTQFIMMSAYGDFAYTKAAFGYRAIDYLLKPVDRAVLNDAVGRAVREYRLTKEKNKEPSDMEQKMDGVKDQNVVSGDQIVRRAMEEIRRDCSRHYTLGDLAKKYHISEAYFSNLFTKVAGVGVMNYIMQVRVEKAKTLLLWTDKKVADISLEVGYEDTRYFSKVFRKITGESPSDYRMRERGELGYE